MPASRSSSASPSAYTPSQLAPPRKTARDVSIAPCPYAFALTIASSSVSRPRMRVSCRALFSIAPRLISTQDGRRGTLFILLYDLYALQRLWLYFSALAAKEKLKQQTKSLLAPRRILC